VNIDFTGLKPKLVIFSITKNIFFFYKNLSLCNLTSHYTDTSNNNNHLSSHEKNIIKKKYKKNMEELNQNPYVNKTNT